jgi:dihydrofolate reductase
MANLIYVTNMSLDGCIEDADGSFAWSEPSDEFMMCITDVVRPVGTWLYGRRLYEAMAVWETDPSIAAASDRNAEFARVWQSGTKVVYSSTLDTTTTRDTQIERRFDPDAVRDMKASAAGALTVGGADLAAQAFTAGLVDECHLFVHPVVVGDGKRALPRDATIRLELRDERRFDNGIVYLHYAVRT